MVENCLMSSVVKDLNEAKLTSYVHHPLSMAMMNSHTNRSIKRRPRSRRDTTRATLSSFDQPATLNTVTGGGGGNTAISTDSNNLCNRGVSTTHTFGLSLADSQQSNNNYLEFLLQSDGSLMHNIQVFSPEFPVFLATTNPQWEKLPVLYSETHSNSSSLPDCKPEPNSCSPDSVIPGFTTDVFDSLEPLSSTPSEWWVGQWRKAWWRSWEYQLWFRLFLRSGRIGFGAMK